MTKRMLIDSTHAEETRVVVLDGNRLEDYDVETSTKQQLKGNIYLAKIVRVEPSLQAAFVEFGGGRHGFLAFGEIHPDYYQIPVADRKRLLEMQEAEAREDEEEEEREAARSERRGRRDRPSASSDAGNGEAGEATMESSTAEAGAAPDEAAALPQDEPAAADSVIEAGYALQADPEGAELAMPRPDQVAQAAAIAQDIIIAPAEAAELFPAAPEPQQEAEAQAVAGSATEVQAEAEAEAVVDAILSAEPEQQADLLAEVLGFGPAAPEAAGPAAEAQVPSLEVIDAPAPDAPESLGGEHDTDEQPDRRSTPRFLRNYKIQEVMRRRQILLVQVVKEERGTKGAALTTYISLAGRFSVLMPNSPRGGGISRKITSAADRRRLKEITAELDLPRGMGLIVRTAGANRPRPEIIRDCEYLLNQWDQIRDLTMKSMAPTLIYEEASLIKRAIRDVYSREVDDILVDGEEGWRAAHDFMRMLMPTHARKVQLWKDPQPLFAKAQVEQQLDAMLLPNVQLRSGGYLVINQTEALVAIDVNSGRSTRERGIEETALRTNLEAAEEAARQLRLRDLAGLIVIDFIDMESRRNNTAVEKKLKDALKNDRARIQIGSISHFGLLEMSRQRLRPSLAETSFITCPHCGGSGHVRGTESAALAVLRGIEDEGSKRRSAEIIVHVAGAVAFYILNHKRVRLGEIEERFGLHVAFSPDESMRAPEMRIERVRAQVTSDLPAPISQLAPPEPFEDPDEEVVVETPDIAEDEDEVEAADSEADRPGETAEEGDQRRKKRRRRRRGGRREDGAAAPDGPAMDDTAGPSEAGSAAGDDDAAPANLEDGALPEQTELLIGTDAEPGSENAGEPVAAEAASAEDGERKRRGRRGGRRRRRDTPAAGEGTEGGEPIEDAVDAPTASAPMTPPPGLPVPAPVPVPMYVGPTPADPFGGSNAFDFFDAIEQAEQQRAMQPVQRAEPASAPAPAPAAVEPAPEPAAPASRAEPEPEVPETVEQPAPVEAPAAETPVQNQTAPPVMVGGDEEPAEKKRGWWRR